MSSSGVQRTCRSCPAVLHPADGHDRCFTCLTWAHVAEEEACVACLALPREERELRRNFMAPKSPPRPVQELVADETDSETSASSSSSSRSCSPRPGRVVHRSTHRSLHRSPPPQPRSRRSPASPLPRSRRSPPSRDWGEESVDVRGASEDEDPVAVYEEKAPDRYPLDQLPGVVATAAARLEVTLPPQPGSAVDVLTGLADPARARRRPEVVSPLVPSLLYYAQREWQNPLSAKNPALAYGPYATVQGWNVAAGVPPIEDGVRMSLLPSSSPWSRSSVSYPSERDRMTCTMLNRCYTNATQVVALANNLALLASSLDKMVHGRDHLSAAELGEVQTSAAAFCRMAQALAIDGGRSMCAAQVACRHLWLGLSALKEADKKELLNLPMSTTSLFGPDMQALVERMENAAKTSAQLAPHLRPQRGSRSTRRRRPRSSPHRSSEPAARRPPHRSRGGRRRGEDRDERSRRPSSGARGGKRGERETFNKGRSARYIQKRAASASINNDLPGAPVVTQSAEMGHMSCTRCALLTGPFCPYAALSDAAKLALSATSSCLSVSPQSRVKRDCTTIRFVPSARRDSCTVTDTFAASASATSHPQNSGRVGPARRVASPSRRVAAASARRRPRFFSGLTANRCLPLGTVATPPRSSGGPLSGSSAEIFAGKPRPPFLFGRAGQGGGVCRRRASLIASRDRLPRAVAAAAAVKLSLSDAVTAPPRSSRAPLSGTLAVSLPGKLRPPTLMGSADLKGVSSHPQSCLSSPFGYTANKGLPLGLGLPRPRVAAPTPGGATMSTRSTLTHSLPCYTMRERKEMMGLPALRVFTSNDGVFSDNHSGTRGHTPARASGVRARADSSLPCNSMMRRDGMIASRSHRVSASSYGVLSCDHFDVRTRTAARPSRARARVALSLSCSSMKRREGMISSRANQVSTSNEGVLSCNNVTARTRTAACPPGARARENHTLSYSSVERREDGISSRSHRVLASTVGILRNNLSDAHGHTSTRPRKRKTSGCSPTAQCRGAKKSRSNGAASADGSRAASVGSRPFRTGPPTTRVVTGNTNCGWARSAALCGTNSTAPDSVSPGVERDWCPSNTLVIKNTAERLCAPVYAQASPIHRNPLDTPAWSRRGFGPNGGDILPAPTRGKDACGAAGREKGVILSVFSGSQKEWGRSPHPGSADSQWLYSQEKFPHADGQTPLGVRQAGRLDDICGPQGRVLPCLHRSGTQEIPSFCSSGSVLRVLPLTVRLLPGPPNLHEVRQSGSGAT